MTKQSGYMGYTMVARARRGPLRGHVTRWAPLEPYGHFLARVRAAGIPGLTAPTEAGGGKPPA